jgi:hypothetical protein
MVSTRHAIVALTLPLVLGAAALANVDRPAVAAPAALLLVVFVATEIVLAGRRRRAAEHVAREAERRAAGPLLAHAPHARDFFYEDCERRRLAG